MGVGEVALSEHEQQALEQLGEALYEQDPNFAHRVCSESASRDGRRRLVLSGLGSVAGLALMLTFCWTTAVAVGVAGFLVMVFCLDRAWTSVRPVLQAKADDVTRPGRAAG